MVLITTLVTPPMLRASFSERFNNKQVKSAVQQEAE
jgi:hypothetical protein